MTLRGPRGITAAVARVVQPGQLVAGHLTRLLGALWVTGGAWLLIGLLAGLFDNGWLPGITGIAVAAVALGATLLAVGGRRLSDAAYALLTVLGAVAISLVVLWGGPIGGVAFGVVYVYVSCFSFIALRAYAVALVTISALLHLAALLTVGHTEAAGVWAVTWGAALVTGLLASAAVVWLEDAVELLQHADDHKTQFIGTVSHELRTPLTAILGATETLQRRWEQLSDEERKHFISLIDRQAARQLRLVDDVLAFSANAVGTAPPQPARVALRALVDDVVEAVAMPVTVRVADHLAVRADPDHVEQVLTNLLVNAERYGEPPVEVRAGAAADTCWIEVVDHGAGLAGGFEGGLLDPFVQGDSGDRRESSGVGLGLTICRDLMASNGGELLYEDTHGGGATFRVVLPLSG